MIKGYIFREEKFDNLLFCFYENLIPQTLVLV